MSGGWYLWCTKLPFDSRLQIISHRNVQGKIPEEVEK